MSGSNTDRTRQGANHLTPIGNEPIVGSDGRPTTRFMQSFQRITSTLSPIPTSDPHVAGQVWIDAGVWKVSAG